MVDALITAMIPLAHVSDMTASIAFYQRLGFDIANSVTPPDAKAPNWALLRSHRAELMLAHATEPIVPEDQAVLFYAYSPDLIATHLALREAGLFPDEIDRPFYNPGGEFRLIDPDGYVLYVAQI